jgi:catechol 2,3-dioxygenase-like lactoylglutathione lyase family enzyme
MLKPLDTLYHVIFSVADFDRSLAFYRDTLDFKVLWEKRDFELAAGSGEVISACRVKRDNDVTGQVELVQFIKPEPNPVPERGYYDLGFWAVVFEVEDLDKIYREWKGRGVEFTREPNRQMVGTRVLHSALIKDIDGNRIELVQEG